MLDWIANKFTHLIVRFSVDFEHKRDNVVCPHCYNVSRGNGGWNLICRSYDDPVIFSLTFFCSSFAHYASKEACANFFVVYATYIFTIAGVYIVPIRNIEVLHNRASQAAS